jgi:hypothetical protein
MCLSDVLALEAIIHTACFQTWAGPSDDAVVLAIAHGIKLPL